MSNSIELDHLGSLTESQQQAKCFEWGCARIPNLFLNICCKWCIGKLAPACEPIWSKGSRRRKKRHHHHRRRATDSTNNVRNPSSEASESMINPSSEHSSAGEGPTCLSVYQLTADVVFSDQASSEYRSPYGSCPPLTDDLMLFEICWDDFSQEDFGATCNNPDEPDPDNRYCYYENTPTASYLLGPKHSSMPIVGLQQRRRSSGPISGLSADCKNDVENLDGNSYTFKLKKDIDEDGEPKTTFSLESNSAELVRVQFTHPLGNQGRHFNLREACWPVTKIQYDKCELRATDRVRDPEYPLGTGYTQGAFGERVWWYAKSSKEMAIKIYGSDS